MGVCSYARVCMSVLFASVYIYMCVYDIYVNLCVCECMRTGGRKGMRCKLLELLKQ